MAAVAHYIEVNAPTQACYDWWRPLTRLPEIMTDVQEVVAKDGDADVTIWTVSGPMGTTLSWTARIVEDAAPRKIAWTTVEDTDTDNDNDNGTDNDVRSSGVVRFDDKGDGRTGVEISLEYAPPAGKLGEAVATLFDDPQSKVEQAAAEFKTLIETR